MKRSINLTKQGEVLDYIGRFTQTHGYSPTVREIGEGVGLKSPASVSKYLDRLEDYGYIRRRPESPRTIEVVGAVSGNIYESIQIPLVKKISQDIPLLEKSNIKDYFSLPASSVPDGNIVFAIEAPDDGMVDKGIKQGDVVFAFGKGYIDNGDCVVCLNGNILEIRDIYMREQGVTLVPANDDFESEDVETCQVVGTVFGSLRKFA